MSTSKSETKRVSSNGPPSAPLLSNDETVAAINSTYSRRPPPPTYEESQRMHESTFNRQAINIHHKTNSYVMDTQIAHSSPPPQYQQQRYVTATAPATFNNARVPNVSGHYTAALSLAPGAKIRTTPSGAISIPPPPPGFAPTPGQYAAMQGQPVLVKKSKRPFF